MQRAVICEGDPTSHGGRVLEGDASATIDGRPIAHLGHKTYCPQCKGGFPIIEGLSFHTFAGVGTAVEGMRTACGATLVATQRRMTIDDGVEEETAPAAASTAPAGPARFSGAFRAVDEKTGQAVAGMPYRIVLPDGRTLRGVTDANGNTERVSGHDPAKLSLHWEVEHPVDDA